MTGCSDQNLLYGATAIRAVGEVAIQGFPAAGTPLPAHSTIKTDAIASFIYYVVTVLTLQEGHPSLNRKERDKEKTQVMVDPLQIYLVVAA